MRQNVRLLEARSGETDGRRWWMNAILLALAVAGIYSLAARLSLALLTPEGVAVFWPAAGVAAGVLIALGPQARWPVVVGTMAATILANLLGDRNIWSSIVFAACNAFEAVLVAALIERYFGSPFNLDRLGNVLGFLAAAIIATAVSGIGGTIGFVLFHASTQSTLATWQDWFASDALGIITIAPIVIGLAAVARERQRRRRSEITEGLIALALLVLMSAIVIALPPDPWTTVVPIALLFPLLLWIAARCRPVYAAAAAFIVTMAIVWTTTVGIGHFGDAGLPMADRVLSARVGIMAVALCAYVLAALFAERRQHVEALTASEASLQEALIAGAVTTFAWDADTATSQRSANATQILDFDPQQGLTADDFLARVHPDDRGRFKALLRSIVPARPSYRVTFRFNRSDGRDVWLEETARAEFDSIGRLARLSGLTLDVTARRQSEEQQRLLLGALEQRFKMLLLRIANVVKDMRHSSGSLDEYVLALDRRIQSISAAHALLSQHHWDGVELAKLVRNQLAPYASDASATIDGPKVVVAVASTYPLAIVMHELVTNAARYGALSTPHGRVDVRWSGGSGDDNLSIEWREIGGPAIAASPEARYGVRIIRNLIPDELGGAVGLAFPPGGVYCRIEIPLVSPRDAAVSFPKIPSRLGFAAEGRNIV
jgi:two-component sensor histidine kinase/integral membrane sensor domain MASE1